jgi:predicted tellurium resistance membrane protein TerC
MIAIHWRADPALWANLLTLTALQLLLGIDNLLLPPARQAAARKLGLTLALITRLTLLASISWIVGLTTPLYCILNNAVAWRDVILVGNGLFLTRPNLAVPER